MAGPTRKRGKRFRRKLSTWKRTRWGSLIAYTPVLTRVLSRNLILIMGCQRSGTTLLYMMISSHPRIAGLNEDEAGYMYPTWLRLLLDLLCRKRTCFKLPTRTGDLPHLRDRFPHARIVWIVRDPQATIASMLSLKMEDGRSWLSVVSAPVLQRHRNMFPELAEIDPAALDELTCAAHIYEYKNRALKEFMASGLTLCTVRFEDLVSHPRETAGRLLSALGPGFDERVLNHQRYHAGREYVGENVGGRPVDGKRASPAVNFSPEDRQTIDTICVTRVALD